MNSLELISKIAEFIAKDNVKMGTTCTYCPIADSGEDCWELCGEKEKIEQWLRDELI